MTAEICTMSMFLNKAEFEAAKAAAKSCTCIGCKAERHDYMKGALEEIRWLLSPQKNEGYPESTITSNTHEAWMRAYTTLRFLEEGAQIKLGPAPAYSTPSQHHSQT